MNGRLLAKKAFQVEISESDNLDIELEESGPESNPEPATETVDPSSVFAPMDTPAMDVEFAQTPKVSAMFFEDEIADDLYHRAQQEFKAFEKFSLISLLEIQNLSAGPHQITSEVYNQIDQRISHKTISLMTNANEPVKYVTLEHEDLFLLEGFNAYKVYIDGALVYENNLPAISKYSYSDAYFHQKRPTIIDSFWFHDSTGALFSKPFNPTLISSTSLNQSVSLLTRFSNYKPGHYDVVEKLVNEFGVEIQSKFYTITVPKTPIQVTQISTYFSKSLNTPNIKILINVIPKT